MEVRVQRHQCLFQFRFLLLCLFVGMTWAIVPAQQANIPARLSFVDGRVQIFRGEALAFDQAQANMPLTAGNRVGTADDGQAEIEFNDGSVARLTPNSSVQIVRLAGTGRTVLQQVSGLAYYELNVSDGQQFTVQFNGASAQPTDNSIVRIDLDNAPELATLEGAVHVSGSAGMQQDVPGGQTLHLDPEDPTQISLSPGVRPESWDQWNSDRDNLIAQQAESQTSARDQSGDGNAPGWNDLDAYGNWYPVEGYGNVWVPDNAGADFDPYGNGAWANYPGVGYTWISGYPWGWLPYHCGAWNHFGSGVGWGWIPGQCGLGWAPVGAIWNAPRGYRPPVQPVFGQPNRPRGLIPVRRGAGGYGTGFGHTPAMHASNAKQIHLDGQDIAPLPMRTNTALTNTGGRLVSSDGHVGVPAGMLRSGPVRSGYRSAASGPARAGTPGAAASPPRPVYTPRPSAGRAPGASRGPGYQTAPGSQIAPTYRAAPDYRAAPAPSVTVPRPMSAPPHISSPPPAPHVAGPAPAAPAGSRH